MSSHLPAPSVGVVIPCLNDAEFLRVSLDALSRQTRVPDRVLVVDNGSQDESVRVAEAAGVHVAHEPRRGIWPASATGYDQIGTDLVFRIDTDSIPPDDWIERGVSRFAADPGLHFLVGPGDFYGGADWANWAGTNLYVGALDPIMTPYYGHACPFGSNLGFTADAWQRVRGHVTRHRRDVHDDMDLAYHIKPWMRAEFDPTWRLEVSARPFDSPASLGKRLGLVGKTVSANWPDARPLVHRRRRKAWRNALGLEP